jgi:O-antigen/teichoic acid export membrane protein
LSAPLVIILPWFGIYTAMFRAQQLMWPIPWLNIWMLIFQIAFTILVFSLGGSIIAIFVVNTLTSAGQLAVAGWIWHHRWFTKEVSGHESVRSLHITSLMRAAWPFAIAGVLAAVQTRVGTVLLERFTDTSNVGYYAASTRFVEAGRLIPNAVFGAIFPILVPLTSQPGQLQRVFKQMMAGLTAFGLILAILCLFWAPTIITLTYGNRFMPAVPLLQAAMGSLLPSMLRSGMTLYWYALKREQFVNVVSGVSLATQLVLSFIFIPTYGAAGAIGVMIAADSVALAILIWPVLRQYMSNHEH